MFYRVRARVRRGEATVRVLVLPADVTALVALGALYLDTGQFLLYVFVLHDQLKVDLEREFSRVSKCLCNMHVHDFNYSSQIWESVINFNILELIEFNKKYSFYTIQLIQKKTWNGESHFWRRWKLISKYREKKVGRNIMSIMPEVMSVLIPELQSDGCQSLPVCSVSRCLILPEWRTGTGSDMSWHSDDRRRGLIVRTHSGSGPRPFSSRHQSLRV